MSSWGWDSPQNGGENQHLRDSQQNPIEVPKSPKLLGVQPVIGWVAQLCFLCTSWLLLSSSFIQCINRFHYEVQQCPWPQKL